MIRTVMTNLYRLGCSHKDKFAFEDEMNKVFQDIFGLDKIGSIAKKCNVKRLNQIFASGYIDRAAFIMMIVPSDASNHDDQVVLRNLIIAQHDVASGRVSDKNKNHWQ